jgi:hypothetical protein
MVQVRERRINPTELWRVVSERETHEAYTQALELFIQALKTFFDGQQGEGLHQYILGVRDEVHDRYRTIATLAKPNTYYTKYLLMLDDQLERKEKLAFQLNENMAMNTN